MKLPKQGVYVDPQTGKILWAWGPLGEEGTPDLLPPRILNHATGEILTVGSPSCVIVDLADSFTAEEMGLVHRMLEDTRVEIEDGKPPRLKLHISTGATSLLVDHPAEQLRAQRRARDAEPHTKK